ncbi:uncharacterized protein LOC109841029 isoform X2 [Asparagus officinalis]|uniref:uncharacterized protein LOC109841029 isoform X2 n=1 Tax=Asparagus officinalis TaxID=4686 RepID=UPI00098E3DDB|nr:uncharacterized protein LOC109841029 isoform X2 [Asparagus officinalis]XP_020265472.1 uncharacterized protein LOC109841029 isoform X2 [Asparagus officinalis]
MEKNYNLMMREIGKLRAELTNADNLDRSGGSYSNTGGYEENDKAGKHSVGQNAYEGAYGVPQGCALSGGGSAGNAPTRPGYDAPAREGPANYA